MKEKDFYKKLEGETPNTIELNGEVLINKNSNKWHICQKKASHVGHACGSGSPYSAKGTETVTAKRALEKRRVCANCERIIEEEFNLNRMVVAVSEDAPIDVTVERFAVRLNEPLDES